MTPEEEAHWRYTLENLDRWNVDLPYRWNAVPDEVAWLREEARYKVHLANALERRKG